MLQRPERSPTVVPEQGGHSVGRARPELTYEDFQKLAAIAQVRDDAKRLWLYQRVCEIARSVWKLYDYCDALSPKLVRTERLSKKILVAWVALTRAAASLKKLLDEFEKALLESHHESNRILERKGISLPQLDAAGARGCIDELAELERTRISLPRLDAAGARGCIDELAELERTRSSRRRSGRPGRPAGSGGDRLFKLLVVDLLTDVKKAGGHLSFNKEDESKGGLCQALRFLAPFLPPHTIPKKLPLVTIARLVRSSSRDQ
jgi:hypothetical protein